MSRGPSPTGPDASRRSATADVGAEDDLAAARRMGELEAELVHLRFRLKESVARELRLVERTLRAEELLDQALSTEHEIREQIARYADFHDAVQRSRAWRIIQMFRRLVGRAW